MSRISFLSILFSVRITTSVYPVPVICRFDQLGDWFEALANVLHWNLRKPQSKLISEKYDQTNDDSSSSSDENKTNLHIRSSSIAASESSLDSDT